MTIKPHLALFLIAGLVLTFAACSKVKNPYKPFEGEWQVTSLNHRLTDLQENLISDTTYTNPGTIFLILDPDEEEDSRFNLFEFTDGLFKMEALNYLDGKFAVYQSGGKNWVHWYADYDNKRLFVWGIAPFATYVQVYTIQEDQIGNNLTLYMVVEENSTYLHEVVKMERK